MNQNEDLLLRQQLRALRRDIAPAADLWPGIQARLADPATPWQGPGRRRSPWWPVALAASLALAAVMGWQLRPAAVQSPAPAMAQAQPSPPSIRGEAVRMSRDYQIALAQLQPRQVPPELAPALGDLDRSVSQILAALEQDPRSRSLLNTLRTTYDRRLQLTRRAVMG